MSRLFRTNHRGTHEVEEGERRTVRVGEKHLVHLVGDEIVEAAPIREAATDQQPATAANQPEVQRVQEATDHRSDLAGLPSAIVAGGVTVPLVIGRVRRLPSVFEAWMSVEFDITARAYAIAESAVPVYGCAAVESKAVFLNLPRIRPSCPLLVLATLGHEAQHIASAHGPVGSEAEAEQERECEDAAERVIVGTVLTATRKTAGPAMDPQKCVECFRRPGGPCRQGEGDQGRVFAALDRFMEIIGG